MKPVDEKMAKDLKGNRGMRSTRKPPLTMPICTDLTHAAFTLM